MKHYIPALALLAILVGFSFYHFRALETHREAWAHELQDFKDQVYSTERFYIENLPIYEDWADAGKESDLRRYLLKDHLAVVEKTGLEPVGSLEEIQQRAKAGALEQLDQDISAPYYFYNVKKEHRYLHPAARKGLLKIAERFQQVLHRNLDSKDNYSPRVVKFAISSALRPVEYQERLRKQNANASFVSSHSYGLSFDLFYDSFYVNLREGRSGATEENENRGDPELLEQSMDEWKLRSGFLLGASLRRQFRAALAETLLQLQKEGLLYAIYERNQRCYHVTILPEAIR